MSEAVTMDQVAGMIVAYNTALRRYNAAFHALFAPGGDTFGAAGCFLSAWAESRWMNHQLLRFTGVPADVRTEAQAADEVLADARLRGEWAERLRVMALQGQRMWEQANPPRTEGEATLRELRQIKALLAAPVVKTSGEPLAAVRAPEPDLPARVSAAAFKPGRLTLLADRSYGLHLVVDGVNCALVHNLRTADLRFIEVRA